jgi:hypothetical protein
MHEPPRLKAHPAKLVMASTDLVPDEPGIYLLAFATTQRFLEKVGYYEFDERRPLTIGGYEACYAGATLGSLRNRVLDHLRRGSEASSLRQTVGALLSQDLGLDVVGGEQRSSFHFGDTEHRLTAWLREHCLVGYLVCDNPFEVERDLIRSIPLPLNISERKRHPFSRYLLSLRACLAARPQGQASSLSIETLLGRSRPLGAPDHVSDGAEAELVEPVDA